MYYIVHQEFIITVLMKRTTVWGFFGGVWSTNGFSHVADDLLPNGPQFLVKSKVQIKATTLPGSH